MTAFYIEKLALVQAKLDHARKPLPRPLVEGLTYSGLKERIPEVRAEVTQAQAVLDEAVQALAAAREALANAQAAEQALRERAAAGELTDASKLKNAVTAIQKATDATALVEPAVEFRKRALNDENRKLLVLASHYQWLIFQMQHREAQVSIDDRIKAEQIEQKAIERLELAEHSFVNGFRSYAEASALLRNALSL